MLIADTEFGVGKFFVCLVLIFTWSCRTTVDETCARAVFNDKYLNLEPISQSTVSKIEKKYRETDFYKGSTKKIAENKLDVLLDSPSQFIASSIRI